MNPTRLLSFGVLALAPLLLTSEASRLDPGGVPASIEDLGFLEGAWFGTDGSSEWETVYTGPMGGEVLGASKELRGDKVVTHDFERFFAKGDSLVMTPFPYGKQSHDFPLVELDESERRAVFENAANDFPSRFIYHRTEDERLTIRLEGNGGGDPIVIEIQFERQ